MTFEDVLRTVRAATGRNIAVPSRAGWAAVDQGGDGVRLDVTLPVAALATNLQTNTAAAPFFALCIAWWLEAAIGRPVRVHVHLDGALPAPPMPGHDPTPELLHTRRGQFLLAEMTSLLGPRFVVTPDPGWTWPSRPVLNAPMIDRSSEHDHDPLSEHALEVYITGSSELVATFPEPIAFLGRQLPVGLFDGVVSKRTAWTPGGASQVDLWGPSPDGSVVHLLELKRSGNTQVGILPEALYYARLLHHFRRGRMQGGAPELAGLRTAERLVMWLVAPAYHPLVHLDGRSPIAWFNAAMEADGVELRVLPIAIDPAGRVRWKPLPG